jgi:hypothetical protein
MRLQRRWQVLLLAGWILMLVVAFFYRHDKHVNYPAAVQAVEVLALVGIPVSLIVIGLRWRYAPVVSLVASVAAIIVACWDVRPHEAGIVELVVFGFIAVVSVAAMRGVEPGRVSLGGSAGNARVDSSPT